MTSRELVRTNPIVPQRQRVHVGQTDPDPDEDSIGGRYRHNLP